MRWVADGWRQFKARFAGGPTEGARPEKMLRARVLVRGRVQGVYYRAHARKRAARLGVTGWIRNLPDGAVEAVLEGNEPSVRAMLEWCGCGSPRAVIASTTVSWEPYTGSFRRFSVREDRL